MVNTIALRVGVSGIPVVGISNSLSQHLLAEYFLTGQPAQNLDAVLANVTAQATDEATGRYGRALESVFTPISGGIRKPSVPVLIVVVGNAAIIRHHPAVRPDLQGGTTSAELPDTLPAIEVPEVIRSVAIRHAGIQGRWPVDIVIEEESRQSATRTVRYKITYETGQLGAAITIR